MPDKSFVGACTAAPAASVFDDDQRQRDADFCDLRDRKRPRIVRARDEPHLRRVQRRRHRARLYQRRGGDAMTANGRASDKLSVCNEHV